MENIYGTCECEAPLEPVWFTEYERNKGIKTGRKRTACSHLVCEYCGVEYQKNREKIEEYRKRSEGRKVLSWLVSGMEWVNEHCIKEE